MLQVDNETLPCFVLASLILLGVFNLFSTVVIENTKGFRGNELTMKPYYLIMIMCVVFMLQQVIAMLFAPTHKLIVLNTINVIKMSIQNVAIAVHIYEWYALYRMIIFQTGYDMTTVEVERRKFKPLEKRHKCVFIATLIFIFAASLVLVVASEFNSTATKLPIFTYAVDRGISAG